MIQKILGCLNYPSNFIKDLAKERHELQKLLTKKNQTRWNEKHTKIVQKLKDICSILPKLRLPNENDNLILLTNASDKTGSHYQKQTWEKYVDIPVELSIITRLIMIQMKKNYLLLLRKSINLKYFYYQNLSQ